MPLYEYKCQSCGAKFEKMVSFSQADQQQMCPNCSSQDTKKCLSTIASRGGGSSCPSTGCSGCKGCG